MFAPSPHSTCARLLGVAAVLWSVMATSACLGSSPFAPPAPQADEILLISTRGIGVRCDPHLLQRELDCRRLTFDSAGQPVWVACDWHNLQQPPAASRRTVFYVHGNRVASGDDAAEGLAVYESLLSARQSAAPLRFVIWSWPSAQIPGLIKDYQVKAVRTTPVAWQLAWFLDQLPAETEIALMGYSYGARTVSGAMHLLGGGTLDGLALPPRQHPKRQPARVALMAAAFDADWLLPGETHQRALSQVDRLVVVTNRHDPAMRFFKLSTKNSRADALGLAGISHEELLGTVRSRVNRIDVTAQVGRSHVLYDYLADHRDMQHMWQQLLGTAETPPTEEAVPAYANLRPSSLR